MQKVLIAVILTVVIAVAFLFALMNVVNLKNANQRAGLKITTNPVSTVYIDNENKGSTPFEISDLKPGIRTIKLVGPSVATAPGKLVPSVEWSRQIKLNTGVTSLINWDLSPDEASSSGEVVTLEQVEDKVTSGADVTVISTPANAKVMMDGKDYGEAPVTATNVTDGDHTFVLSKDGYKQREIRIKTFPKHKFQIEATLAAENRTQGGSSIQIEENVEKVVILSTGTGWLRVRNSPGLGGEEIAKVNPGETYPLIEEKSGWVHIRLKDGKDGWVLGSYTKKI